MRAPFKRWVDDVCPRPAGRAAADLGGGLQPSKTEKGGWGAAPRRISTVHVRRKCESLGPTDIPKIGPEIFDLGITSVTKLYKSIGFGATDVTKPHKFIGFGAMDARRITPVQSDPQ